jgi:hypothetical protein
MRSTDVSELPWASSILVMVPSCRLGTDLWAFFRGYCAKYDV